ncbi:MAG: hypothetical protein ACOC5T_08045 [Elusimicrobiota bacterium]
MNIVNATSKLTPIDGSIAKTMVDKKAKEAIVIRTELSIIKDRYAPGLISM